MEQPGQAGGLADRRRGVELEGHRPRQAADPPGVTERAGVVLAEERREVDYLDRCSLRHGRFHGHGRFHTC